ncbi:MAG: methyltransferase, partial [Halioglobus sp.]
SGPKSTEEIALKLVVLARPLDVYLGYLVAMGLAERHEGLWQASAQGAAWLEPGSGGYWGPLFEAFQQSKPLHQQILMTLKQQLVAISPQSAVHEWERGELPPERAAAIAAFMNSLSISAAEALSRNYMFNDSKNVLDVGGGSGAYAIGLAKAHEHLRATVLDIDSMCRVADEYILASEIADRVNTVAMNMFIDKLPKGYDTHLFSNIFHDWSEETNEILASRSFDALPHGGKILLHEMLVDDDGCGPLTTLSFSVLMLIGTRGRQYKLSELRVILENAGFVEVQATQTGSGYYSVVSARKP